MRLTGLVWRSVNDASTRASYTALEAVAALGAALGATMGGGALRGDMGGADGTEPAGRLK